MKEIHSSASYYIEHHFLQNLLLTLLCINLLADRN